MIVKKNSSTEKMGAWFKGNMSRENLRTAMRMAIGIIVSVIIAQFAGLEFATSTCIVTLLGIQSTKRDTIRTAGQRIISLAYTILLAVLIAKFFGVDLAAFCIGVIILAVITYVIGWNSTLSINVVVLVHLFLQQMPFTAALLENEILRVFIGLVVALIINWRMPTKEREFLKDMADIENTLEHALNTLASVLRGEEKLTAEFGDHLKGLGDTLQSGMDNAYTFANNNLSSHAKYYMHYISLRKTDTLILFNIYHFVREDIAVNEYTMKLADCMDEFGHSIALEHPMDDLEQKREDLNHAIAEASLPATKKELRDRSLIFFISGSIQEMVEAKEQFIDALSDEEKEHYWTREHR